MVAALFLPLAADLSAFNIFRNVGARDVDAHWLVSFPAALALLATFIAFVPQQSARGLIMCGIWVIGCVASAGYVHESAYLDSATGERLREGGWLLLQPGLLVYIAGLGAIGVSSLFSLGPLRDVRAILPLAGVLTLAAVAIIVTEIGGLRTPQPEVATNSTYVNDAAQPAFETQVKVTNEGRRFMLLSSHSTLRNAYDFLLERKIGSDSWEESAPPIAFRTGDSPRPMPRAGAPENIPLQPSESAAFTYMLPPGEYRVQLGSKAAGWRTASAFTLKLPADAVAPTGVAPVALPPGPEAALPEVQTPVTETPSIPAELADMLTAEVMLRGIMAQPGRAASFSIQVTLPDGRSRQQSYSVGDEVHDGWAVSEFNPKEQTVTLGKGSQILILRRGDPYELRPGN
ncbi:MAG: hypothetical protein WC655_04525 [Candidatus Hydrogenedentales bacterium]|jgi:hypothetical protein